MISAVDSFVEYINAELAGAVPVAYMRPPTQPERLTDDALNVTVIDFAREGRLETALVSLDILGSDLRTVLGQSEKILDILRTVQYTPELDYSATPDAPVATGRMVSWDADVTFSVVASEHRYVHANATFLISRAR